jgi:hypothetical protein
LVLDVRRSLVRRRLVAAERVVQLHVHADTA